MACDTNCCNNGLRDKSLGLAIFTEHGAIRKMAMLALPRSDVVQVVQEAEAFPGYHSETYIDTRRS
jgi:hypothetical protein